MLVFQPISEPVTKIFTEAAFTRTRFQNESFSFGRKRIETCLSTRESVTCILGNSDMFNSFPVPIDYVNTSTRHHFENVKKGNQQGFM